MWDALHPLVRVIIIASVSGVVGTVVGGLLGIIVKKPSKMYIGLMLALGSGAMLGMAIFEMMPASFEYIHDYLELHWGWGVMVVVLGVAVGCAAVFGLGVLVDHIRKKRRKKLAACSCKGDESILYEGVCEEERNAKVTEVQSDDTPTTEKTAEKETIDTIHPSERKKLFSLGLIVFMAIILHDLPEGMAIGAGEHIGIGLAIGIMMLLHNIPEGFAIAIPLKASGVKIWKIIGLCALAGIPALLGGIIGWAIGLNEILAASTLAFASGAMIFVVFKEMLPTAYKYTKKRHAITTVCLVAGILLMVVFSAALH